MTNANSIFWGAMRQRDILGGLAIFIALNSALFAIIILASDISSSGQVALAIFAVLSNFLVWLWNDSGIKDVHAGSKDITGDDAETAIAQEFKKAPWAFYRGIVIVIALVIAIEIASTRTAIAIPMAPVMAAAAGTMCCCI